MRKKLFRWLAVFFGVLLLLLVALVAGVNRYLATNQERFLQDLATKAGLEVTLGEIDLSLWRQFPRLTVRVDSLVVRDTTVSLRHPPLLDAQHLKAEFSVAKVLSRRIDVRAFEMADAKLHLASDSSGAFGVGNLLNPVSSHLSPLFKVAWDGVLLRLQRVDLLYHHPISSKHMEATIDTLRAQIARPSPDSTTITAALGTSVGGISFNTRYGAYLTNTPLGGALEVGVNTQQITLAPTRLAVGQQFFDVDATISLQKGDTSYININNEHTDYELSRKLLHDTLQVQLAKHYVDAPFPVQARVKTTLATGSDPEIRVNFKLTGQGVRIQQYAFREVYTNGKLVNRLTGEEGGIPGSRKNLRFDLDSVRGFREDVFIEAPRALVAIANNRPRLQAPLTLAGPAPAVSRWLENRDFFFEQGRFVLQTSVNALLDDFEQVITETDARLWVSDTKVVYQPANVRFPFKKIYLAKKAQDVNFRLQSRALPTGFIFDLRGTIDNLVPLFVDVPGGELVTNVSLEAPRLDWADFLAFFGQDGYLHTENTVANPVDTLFVSNLKQTLTGLEKRFDPAIYARFDTVAYFDLFTLTDFSTGLHFVQDTLILEQTNFNWAGSALGFGARLHLGQVGQTPFRINAQAEHLNLNRLRPTLNYFGLQLPAELDSLPDDLTIDFNHQGKIRDAQGIMPGFNQGNLHFDDGKNHLFSGRMNYGPGPDGLHTHFLLNGDPQLVNVLFGAEIFFFGTGTFALDLELAGIPKSLPELLAGSSLNLRVEDSRVTYQPAAVYVPVRYFDVKVEEGRAAYALDLLTEKTQRSVCFTGALDPLSAFLSPRPTAPFKMKANATAQALAWSDLQHFFQPTEQRDTDSSSAAIWLSATEGIFNTFRPNLSLQIDSFWLWDKTPITNLHSGLYLQDTNLLVLEESGFSLGEGSVKFQATYALDDYNESPFALSWAIKDLDLRTAQRQLSQQDTTSILPGGSLSGQLSATGTMVGLLDEQQRRVVFDSTRGDIDVDLTGIEMSGWPFLQEIGRKTMMRKRFQHVRIGPLHARLQLENNLLTIPRTEIQTTPLQLFVEGKYDLNRGPDLLLTVPLRNIGRGVLNSPPSPTGYAQAGGKVFIVIPTPVSLADKTKAKLRLGRRKYHRERGTLEAWRQEKAQWRATRKASKRLRKTTKD